MALTPKAKTASNGHPPVANGANGSVLPVSGLTSGDCGWCGDHESDIPVSLLAKHVMGMHAAADMAFHKDFEAIHECGAQYNWRNGAALNAENGSAFPDILNGRGWYFVCTRYKWFFGFAVKICERVEMQKTFFHGRTDVQFRTEKAQKCYEIAKRVLDYTDKNISIC